MQAIAFLYLGHRLGCSPTWFLLTQAMLIGTGEPLREQRQIQTYRLNICFIFSHVENKFDGTPVKR